MSTTSAPPRTTSHAIEPAGRTRYGVAVPALLVAAFSLSAIHTVYARLSGLEDPDFTVMPALSASSSWVRDRSSRKARSSVAKLSPTERTLVARGRGRGSTVVVLWVSRPHPALEAGT